MSNKNRELIALASAIIGTYSEFNPYDYVDFKAVSNFSTLKVNFQNRSKKEILKTENKNLEVFQKTKTLKYLRLIEPQMTLENYKNKNAPFLVRFYIKTLTPQISNHLAQHKSFC